MSIPKLHLFQLFSHIKYISNLRSKMSMIKDSGNMFDRKINQQSQKVNYCTSKPETSKARTAGIIVIGDEILNGQTLDTNTKFLAQNLYKLGVKVEKVSVIPDDVDVIAEEVSIFSKKYNHVITSGGIGPTHDDVTFEGVAAAFQEPLQYHPLIVDFIKIWFGTNDENSPAMKMAKVPKSSILYFGEDGNTAMRPKFPCISVRNVCVFPGIPHLLKTLFNRVGKNLFGYEGNKFLTHELYLTLDEVSLAEKLNLAVSKFPHVKFGSYPVLFNSYYRTKITMESLEASKIKEAAEFLRANFDTEHVVDYVVDTVTDPWKYLERLSPALHSLVEQSMDTMKQCFERFVPEEVCLCYNGGKDCLVALHITHMFLKRQHPDKKIQAVYITEKNAFPQVTEFVHESIDRYNLDCEIIPGPLKSALLELTKKRPLVKAVIMGTRRIDPHGDNLQLFSPTDGDWPPMIRVNPILEWNYGEVWQFIRQLCLPYCTLYDRGYTSLGSLDNTLPNPHLERKDTFGHTTFQPAYLLEDANQERKGRIF